MSVYVAPRAPEGVRTRARTLAAASALLALCGLTGCAPPPRGARTALDDDFARLLGGAALPQSPPTAADWNVARQRLDALRREARGAGARTLRIRLSLREPHTGQTLEARGAVAISPALGVLTNGDSEGAGALRMILLGPGGTTALDLWTRGDRFRFAVPALDLLKRGDASTPRASLRGLPVEFLRWWLLRPAQGTLLWYGRAGSTDTFLLRDGDAMIDLRLAEGGRLGARRRTWIHGSDGVARLADEEIVLAERVGCGDVRYAQASTGLLIRVTCEGEERDRAPDPRAFVDPDAVAGAAP